MTSIGYDPETRQMEIEFIRGGLYRYFNVPEEVYQGLKDAGSPGQFFDSDIKGSYSYERV